MPSRPNHHELSSFDAIRAMSTVDARTDDADRWAREIQSVARRRDRDSFMRIYDHFAPRVRLFLRGRGASETIAEDLAQEALLRLWQHADVYDPHLSNVSTWLFRIARNLYIDRCRRDQHWSLVDIAPMLDLVEEPENPAFSSAESYAAKVDLNERIERLPAAQARLIRMSYFEAKSHQQIADELGMPLGTVKSSIRRAFLRLQSSVQGAV